MRKFVYILVILLAFIFIGCDNESNCYTIVFETNGGTVINGQTIDENEKVTRPADPTKEGYTFSGWYLNDELYDFETLVTSNLTLTAKWDKDSNEPKQFTVTFNSDGGTVVESVTILEGNTVTKPSDPTKNGYQFAGWYLNNVKFDFNTVITSDIELKAKWSTESGWLPLV